MENPGALPTQTPLRRQEGRWEEQPQGWTSFAPDRAFPGGPRRTSSPYQTPAGFVPYFGYKLLNVSKVCVTAESDCSPRERPLVAAIAAERPHNAPDLIFSVRKRFYRLDEALEDQMGFLTAEEAVMPPEPSWFSPASRRCSGGGGAVPVPVACESRGRRPGAGMSTGCRAPGEDPAPERAPPRAATDIPASKGSRDDARGGRLLGCVPGGLPLRRLPSRLACWQTQPWLIQEIFPLLGFGLKLGVGEG